MIVTSFIILGFVVAFTSQQVYTSETLFIIKSNSSGGVGGNLSGLASLAGINLQGTNESSVPLGVYPRILNSAEFRRNLSQTKVWSWEKADSVSYVEYYKDFKGSKSIMVSIGDFFKSIPGRIKSLIVSPEPTVEINSSGGESKYIFISEEENKDHQRIASQLKFSINEIENFIAISYTMPDRVNAAVMTDKATQLLQKKIIEIRTKNATEHLNFVTQRFQEQKVLFDEASDKLAEYKDKNLNLQTEKANQEINRLQSEYDILSEVYYELVRQLEQAKIQVSKETPTFSIIEEPQIPLSRSAPSRALILIMYTILGGILSIVVVVAPIVYKGIRQKFQ